MVLLREYRSATEDAFRQRNVGHYAIRHAGTIITAKAFDTKREAEEWAKWNYKNRANWSVEKL